MIPSNAGWIDQLTGGKSDEVAGKEAAQWLQANPQEIPRIVEWLKLNGPALSSYVPGTPDFSAQTWSRVLSEYFGYGPELQRAYEAARWFGAMDVPGISQQDLR